MSRGTFAFIGMVVMSGAGGVLLCIDNRGIPSACIFFAVTVYAAVIAALEDSRR